MFVVFEFYTAIVGALKITNGPKGLPDNYNNQYYESNSNKTTYFRCT